MDFKDMLENKILCVSLLSYTCRLPRCSAQITHLSVNFNCDHFVECGKKCLYCIDGLI